MSILASKLRCSVGNGAAAAVGTLRCISKIIYFKNMPKYVTNQMLGKLAVEYGDYSYVGVVACKTSSANKGLIGIIEFKTQLAAQSLMDELQSTTMFNRRLELEFGSANGGSKATYTKHRHRIHKGNEYNSDKKSKGSASETK